MAEYEQRSQADRIDFARLLEDATPGRRVAPMPRQVLVFWTPRRALRAGLRLMKELRRSQQPRRAVVPIPNLDEPR